MPGVQVARPQVGGVGRGGQQGPSGEGAAAQEVAAGDQRDQQEHQEEHRARFAGDALEAGELFDLEEVGVVAAGAGLDGAAVPAGSGRGLGVGGSEEVSRDVFDGGPHGRAGRREQRAQFVLFDLGAAAASAPGDDPLGPQEGAQQAADLVEGLSGDLADEVGDGPQEGADDEAEQDPGQQGRTAVDEEGVDGAGLVDLVGRGRGAARAVDGASLAGGRLGVPDDGVGGDEDAVAGGVRPPAQVDVVTHEGQAAVEAAEFLEDVAAHEHAGGGHRQHGADVVVLALVLFAAVQAGPAAAGVGDGDADLEELTAVVPAAELGADDGDVVTAEFGFGLHDAQQFGQGLGLGRAVVVQQPQPLDGFAVRKVGQVVGVVAPGARDGVPAARALQVRQFVGGEDRGGAVGLLDGLAEAGAPGQVQDAVGAEGVGDQLGRVVRAAGVGGHDGLDGTLLGEQPGERVGQPAGAVVGDEDRGHHVTRELRSGSVALTCRLVHGHRGTGPGSVDCGGRLRRVGAAGCLGRAPTLAAGHDGGPPPVDNPPATGRSKPRARPPSHGRLLQSAALPLGQAAPDAESLVVGEGVLEAFGADLTREAHLLGLAGGATLLGEEGLGVGLGAQCALLPAEFLVRVVDVDQQLLHQLGHVRPSLCLSRPRDVAVTDVG
ncbi:hypothetical protein RKD18_003583 [Streptomyces phaeoluteigriseus]